MPGSCGIIRVRPACVAQVASLLKMGGGHFVTEDVPDFGTSAPPGMGLENAPR
jgi:hypothetical protein